ncbi:hypothetical protein RRG08_021949 [Elysia crispata]|uniref:Apextrin C-terminal domain-containing protein n=1 Tax=Elysia crispata TaxID=231223 RepID=A0AAE1AC11_9GAST|nr:hypothetical protein RRG08_021949 [Elysia crispata]
MRLIRVTIWSFETLITGSDIKTCETLITGSDIKTCETLITGSDIKTCETLITGSDIKTCETLITGSDIKTCETLITGSDIKTCETLITGSDIKTCETLITGSDIKTCETLITGSDIKTCETLITGSDIKTCETLITGSDIKTCETLITGSDIKTCETLITGSDIKTCETLITGSDIKTCETLITGSDIKTCETLITGSDIKTCGNSKSSVLDLKGQYTDDSVEQHFCVKDSAPNDFSWPGGNFCVYRRGEDCPDGFTEGFVQYDDGQGSGAMSGDLPGGVYGDDTRFEYCCKSTGFSEQELHLPSRTPFVLFHNGQNDCQNVREVYVKSYIALMPTESAWWITPTSLFSPKEASTNCCLWACRQPFSSSMMFF